MENRRIGTIVESENDLWKMLRKNRRIGRIVQSENDLRKIIKENRIIWNYSRRIGKLLKISCGKSENITPKSDYTILRFSHNRTVLSMALQVIFANKSSSSTKQSVTLFWSFPGWKTPEEASVRTAIFKSPGQKSLQSKKSLKPRPHARQIEQILTKLINYFM